MVVAVEEEVLLIQMSVEQVLRDKDLVVQLVIT
jgi:hypothetical protein